MRCLCLTSATAGLGASARSLTHRGGAWSGGLGLCLAAPFLALVFWFQPSALGASAAMLGGAALVGWRWRASQARLARWRARRDQALQEELRALRQQKGRA